MRAIVMAVLACALSLLLVSALPGYSIARAVDIHGNDAQDTYTGVGGLVLPATADPQARREAASCADCAWQVGDACDTPYGVAFLRCQSTVLHCPSGSAERRAWMRHGNGQWYDQGLLCVTSDGPPTVTTVGRRAHGAFVQHLPSLTPSSQPAQGIVAQLPVLFDSGQSSGPSVLDVTLAGASVHLEARPTWTWIFGDGSSQSTGVAGAHWPDVRVAHTYRQPGDVTVRVVTHWTASFWVNGLGPFPVAEGVAQEATVALRVGEGRAAIIQAR